MELEGKIAIVTGAGGAGVGGLGVTYAEALAEDGASVVVSDIDGEAAQRVAKAGAKQIYFYKDLKVTFNNGKASDVE